MWSQRSTDSERAAGTLYLVPTPIGNLEDMTFRAVRLLKEADVIAAEDTRHTKKLCRHYEVDTPLISYHEHNKETSGRKLVEALEAGKTVALVSDAGTPVISDPGYELVRACLSRRLHVVPLPGASAVLPALAASGLATDQFFFAGFLPRGRNDRKHRLQDLKTVRATMIFYEAPHRVQQTVADMAEVLGDRNMCIARELTKSYEEWVRGNLYTIWQWLRESGNLKGEWCIVVEGASKDAARESPWWEEITVVDHVRHYVDIRGMSSKEAVKRTAKERGVPKRDVYHAYHAGGKGNLR